MRSLLWMVCAVASLLAQEPQEARMPFAGAELVYLHNLPPPASQPLPLLVVLHNDAAGPIEAAKATWRRWQPSISERGWVLVVPWTRSGAPPWTDAGVKTLEAVVEDAKKRFPVDATRIYLAGLGDGAAQVFYAASRLPDLWCAGLAIQGDPKIAIDTNRLFGANTLRVPVLWVVRPEDQADAEPFRQKLASAGYNLQFRASTGLTISQALDWLSSNHREPAPPKIDCETGSTGFTRCYWIRITRFDPSLRNDVLPSTRVQPGAGGYLDLGGFRFNPSAPGPGVVVGWLPENYKGPLQLQDRIVSAGSRQVRDAKDYLRMMDEVKEEKAVAILIERGGKRHRLETRVLLPRREENLTARVQAEFVADLQELQVISRGVAEMRIEVPAGWAPCRINWNGQSLANVQSPGCWNLVFSGEARPCRP